MYVRPQAWLLAYIEVIKHLKLHSYTRVGFTSGLFRRATRDTLFSLVVDDFGVKYTAKNYALYLINTLKKKYPSITIYSSDIIFLGIQLDWEYNICTVNISMPNYVKKSLSRFEQKNLNMTNIHHIHMQHQIMAPRSSMYLPVPLPI